MESGVDDAGLHSPLLGGYTATEAPPNTPHGAQGSSTTPSGLPHDKIAPVIACTLPALTDSIPERKRGELAGEVTRELQVVGKAASIAIQTWVRNNDKTKARAEEREKYIGWIKRLFTAWRVSHDERNERLSPSANQGPAPSSTPSPCVMI